MLWKIAKAGKNETLDFAASELKRILQQMDASHEFILLRYDAYDPSLKDVLWLGVCPQVQALVKEPAYDDAIDIQVQDGVGTIRGSNPRSVLIGVYRFLRELGCAWIRPGVEGEIIPRKDLSHVSISVKEAASCRHRGICIEGGNSYDDVVNLIDWLPKLGMNAYYIQFLNPFTFYDRWYNHTYNDLVPKTPLTADEVRGIRDQTVAEIKRRGLLYHAVGHGWTCVPFDIPGDSWDKLEDFKPTPEQTAVLAEMNGKRELLSGVSLSTNLCYSQAKVREQIAKTIVDYCRKTPEVDFLHLWLADSGNSFCECAECRKKQASDWYVMLLNEVDDAMTKAGLPQKVVFLLYFDTLWAPLEEQIRNPDRFVLMFAPISRSYSISLCESEPFDEQKLPPYALNHQSFPKSPGENLAWLRQWQKQFHGDSFIFDYHLMWDHYKDPGYYNMAELLFKDMQDLHRLGLNGNVAPQPHRIFFPTALGDVSMAAALWNENARFEDVAAAYFDAAFGDGQAVQQYLKRLSDAFDSPYIREEKPRVSKESAERYRAIPAMLDEYTAMIDSHVKDTSLHPSVRQSWVYLQYHATYCRLFANAQCARAEGDDDRMKQYWQKLSLWIQQNEPALHPVLDLFEVHSTLLYHIFNH